LNRKVLLAGAAIILPVLSILFLNLGRDPHRVQSPMVGKPAPSFTLKEAGTDRVLSLESLRGKPAVVNFWATWCLPCYAEHEVLVRNARNVGSGVQFVGVVYDDTEDKIQQFLSENGSAYPSVMDDGGRTAIAYGVYGVPETFFVSPSGVIVAKEEGPLTQESITRNLQEVMKSR
jgi:cytochrome c biogenesis protein CcmG, thiol:disulfide interchange protein DsbE